MKTSSPPAAARVAAAPISVSPVVPLAGRLALALALAAPTWAAAQAPNDTRATAAELLLRGPDQCIGTEVNLHEASLAERLPGCATDPGGGLRDAWYYFVPTDTLATLNLQIVRRGSQTFSFYAQVERADGTALFCERLTPFQPFRLPLTGLTPGERVYVQLANVSAAAQTRASVCAFATPTCLAPLDPQSIHGQNWAQVQFQRGDGTAALTGEYQVWAGRAGWRPNLPGRVASARSTYQPITVWGLEPGEFYYFYVREVCAPGDTSAWATPVQRFGQRAVGPPPNDSVALDGAGRVSNGPQRLSGLLRSPRPTPGTTRNATPQPGLGLDACGGVADDDVWYSLRASLPSYRLIVQPAPGIATDLVVEVRDSALGLLRCVNEAPGGSAEGFTLNGLREGSTTYLRVYTAEPDAVADFEVIPLGQDGSILSDTGCVDALNVTLDGTGRTGEFVDVRSLEGDIVVSIENTQRLGAVSVSYFGASDSLRRAQPPGEPPVFYTRNSLTIAPELVPADSVLVRFYLAGEDIIALVESDSTEVPGVSAEDCVQFTRPEVIAVVRSSGATGGGVRVKARGVINVCVDSAALDMAVARVANARCSADYPGSGLLGRPVGTGVYGNGLYVDVRLPPNFATLDAGGREGFEAFTGAGLAAPAEFFFSPGGASLPVVSGFAERRPEVRELRVYPNPAREQLWVEWPGEGSSAVGTAASWQIVDVAGRVQRRGRGEGTAASVALDGLAAGYYVLVAEGAGGVYRAAFVVEE